MRTPFVHRRPWHRHTRAAVASMATSAFVVLAGLSCTTTLRTTSASTGCVFRTSPGAAPAFCDTFDQPVGTGNRAGDLNGVVWGASRATSNDNPASLIYSWADVGLNACGTTRNVQPDHDIAICNGQAIEAVNDNGGVTVLGMYPKQPFDFAGRTGTVVFDVSNNSQGPHAAWPAFVLTDQPVPAPYGSAAGLSDNARNSIGFSMGLVCYQYGCGPNSPPGSDQPGFSCLGVDDMFLTSNYQWHDLVNSINYDGCVLPSSGPGHNNHVEVQLSSTGMKMYASDPDQPSTTRLIADASFTAPLTRGLVWMEDVHYNAGKFDTQQTNTFSWDNVGFDGPVLRRDLAFDVPDALTAGQPAENGLPTSNLGYYAPAPGNGTVSVTVPNVTGSSNASAALLTLNYWPHGTDTLTYSVNGHAAHQFAWPFGPNGVTFVSQTVAMPVPLSDIQPGNNVVQISTSDADGVSIANIDLILVGAGGVPATPAPTPAPSPTPAPTPTPSPMSITNVPCTVVIQSQSQLGTCSGTFTPK